jgi:predicted phosphodiesterase
VQLTRGPYLTGASQTTMTIMWTTATATDSVVQYGNATSASTVGSTSTQETTHSVPISGLTPGTTYTYRIITGGTGSWTQVGNISQFTTATTSSALSTTVVAFGDSGQDTPAQDQVGALVASETFDFLMHCGDVIYEQGQMAGYDTSFFPQYGSFINSHPIFGAVGNHDLETANGGPYISVFNPPSNNPQNNPLYYSFTWGNVKFVSIDSTGIFTANGPWGTWFQSELANNTSRWLVVVMHAPLFSNDTTHGDDANLQSLWQGIIEDNKVDLVLAGHAHIYQRTNKIKMISTDPTYGGWVEIVTGGGGAALYGIGATTAVPPAYTESCNHYTKLTFTQNELGVKVVRADGTTAENVTIAHN